MTLTALGKNIVLYGSLLVGGFVGGLGTVVTYDYLHPQSIPMPFPQPPPVVGLPTELQADVGDLVQLTATTLGLPVAEWESSLKLAVFGNTAVVSSKTPGTFYVSARVVSNGQIGRAVCHVTIGNSPTPPNPPNPPNPPVDNLTQTAQAAFTAETDTAKVANVKALSAVYRNAALSTINDPSIKTYGDLFAIMKTASASLLPVDGIPKVRAAIGAYENSQLGTDPTKPLDKVLAGTVFTKVSTVLDGLK